MNGGGGVLFNSSCWHSQSQKRTQLSFHFRRSVTLWSKPKVFKVVLFCAEVSPMASAASAAGSAETRVEFRIDMHSLCNFHEKRARDQLTNILKALDDVPAHHKTIEDSIIVFGEVATPAAASLLFARCTPHWGPQVGDKRVCHVYEYVKTKSHIKKGPPDGFCIIQSADVWWVRQCPDEGSLLWDVNCVILQHR